MKHFTETYCLHLQCRRVKFFHLENKGSTLLQNITFVVTAIRTSNLTPSIPVLTFRQETNLNHRESENI
jgi:hypothetical protein